MISVIDLQDLYKTYFSKQPYYITPKGEAKPITNDVVFSGITQNPNAKGTIHKSATNQPFNKIGLYGHDIWGAITLEVKDKLRLEIEVCTVAVNLSKTIIRTAVSERKGTVKECFAVDDYKFTIKGFLINKNKTFPEQEILKLKEIFETTEPVFLHGGYPELFLDESCRVAIATLDFPEVQGKSPWIKPFSLTCESDFIQDLIAP